MTATRRQQRQQGRQWTWWTVAMATAMVVTAMMMSRVDAQRGRLLHRTPYNGIPARTLGMRSPPPPRSSPRGYSYYGRRRRQQQEQLSPPIQEGAAARRTPNDKTPSSSSSSSLSSSSSSSSPPPGHARSYYSQLRQYRVNDFSWTNTLTLWSGLIYLLQMMRPSVTRWGMKRSDVWETREWHRLVTPIALHGNPLHLMTNMSSLQSVGKFVERYFGRTRFLLVYLVSGVAGNVVSAWQTPAPSVGASGAIFGLVGAQMIFLQRNASGQQAQASLMNLSQTILLNVVYGMTNPTIDNWAHVGGFLGGAFMAHAIGPNLKRIYVNGRAVIVDEPLIGVPQRVQNWGRQLVPRKVQKWLVLPRFGRGKNRRPPPPPGRSHLRPGAEPWW